MLDADFDSELSANWIGSDILRVAGEHSRPPPFPIPGKTHFMTGS